MVLGQALYELGRVDDAISLFENWLAEEPDNPVATHLLAAYQGQQVPARCSSQYIEQTFDAFANSFESVLGRLKYCGPQLVQDHLAALDLPASSLNVLDLGCGTGMVGEVIKPYARELVGVDLSQAMLDRSAAKQLYRQLHKSDITEFLLGIRDHYDLITCMDTFVYLGRLDEVHRTDLPEAESRRNVALQHREVAGDFRACLSIEHQRQIQSSSRLPDSVTGQYRIQTATHTDVPIRTSPAARSKDSLFARVARNP